ncbi:MAG: carbohydrate-binding domain-containing protein [Clostridium sp.]|nr:carbohydrate-binding domain-containing protein [Clostridium sp.]
MYSKYSFHRRLTLRLLCIALCACMALNGCSSTSLPDDTLSSEQEETESSVSSSEDSAYTYSDYELDDSFDRQSAASITLSGSTAQSNGSGVSINNATVTISKEGCYLISGELEDGQIIVDAGDSDKVQLVLDKASIHCSTGSAILVRNADKVKVTLAADSENELSDGTEYQTDDDNPDAALFSKDDLVINGSGSLTVQGNYKHGIAGNDDLVITGGRLTVNSLSHALRGKDSVAILDGTFVLTSQKDGIQASNTEDSTKGWVQIDGGNFTIQSSGDGIQAETNLSIYDGSFTITSGGGAVNGADHTENRGGGFGRPGGNRPDSANGQTSPEMPSQPAEGGQTPSEMPSQPAEGGQTPSEMPSQPAEGEQSSSGNESDYSELIFDPDDFDDTSTDDSDTTVSTKGIKAGNALLIQQGTFVIDSADDAIHSNYSVTIDGGSFQLSSGDDGIHAEAYLNINGGTTTIAESYEGLEAAQIHISGGTTQVSSSDDGLNATGGSSFELVDGLLVLKDISSSDTEQTFGGRGGMFEVEDNCDIIISGGNLTVTTSNGDGIDSNGSLNVSGSTVLVFGSSSGGEGALDYTGSSSISGGTLVALGSSGMAQSMEPDDSHATLMVTWDEVQPAGTRLTLCTQQGEILCSLQSTNSFQTAVISTDSLSAGQEVSLYTGGTVNSDSQLLTMGTLSDGELLCEVTLAEGVTNISSDGSQRSSQPGGSFGGGQHPQGDRKQRPQQELTIGSSAESNS